MAEVLFAEYINYIMFSFSSFTIHESSSKTKVQFKDNYQNQTWDCNHAAGLASCLSYESFELILQMVLFAVDLLEFHYVNVIGLQIRSFLHHQGYGPSYIAIG